MQIMLLEVAIDLQIIQVVEDEGPPPSSVTGEHFCAHCNQKLHGHGWCRGVVPPAASLIEVVFQAIILEVSIEKLFHSESLED